MTKRQEAIRNVLDAQRQKEGDKSTKAKEKQKLEELLRMRGIRHSVIESEPKKLGIHVPLPQMRSLSPQNEITPVIEKPQKNQILSIAEIRKHLVSIKKPN